MLFPEGARQSGPIVQPLFDGAVYVAAKAGVPIVPVGVGGSERCMPKGSKLIYPQDPRDRRRPDRAARDRRSSSRPRELAKTTEELSNSLQALFDAAQIRAGVR